MALNDLGTQEMSKALNEIGSNQSELSTTPKPRMQPAVAQSSATQPSSSIAAEEPSMIVEGIDDEQMKQKQKWLQDQIRDKYTHVLQEQRRLEKLTQQLNTLEAPTRSNVESLRDQITAISVEVEGCRQVYEKCKSDLVAAEQNLHQKTEQKRLLSTRLCNLLFESEVTKSAKLEEMVCKLGSQSSTTMETVPPEGPAFDGF